MPQSFVALFYYMRYFNLKTLENLTAIIDGVTYVEKWKPITKPVKLHGYKISSFGRIKRDAHFNKTDGKFIKEKILSQSASRYLKIRKRRNSLSVHRLVGMHFIPNPYNKPQINHKDLDKWNNHVSNLEWSTQSENIVHGQMNGVFKFAKPKPPLKLKHERNMKGGICKPIIDINTGVFYTSNELAFLLNTSRKNICRMISEERKPNTTSYRYA